MVILTGYGEFEFAKKAIEFKVSEFVLKPVGAEELVEVVLKLKDEIAAEKRRMEARRSYEKLLKENLPVIQGRFINKLINASYTLKDKDRVIKKINTLGMDLSGPLFQVFIIAIDDYFFRVGNQSPENRELIFDSVLNIAGEALATYTKGHICRNEMGLFVGVVNTGNHSFDITAMCKQIQYLISKHLKLSVSIGVGNERKDILSVFESYNEAFNALRNRVYRGKSVVIDINDVIKDSGHAGMVCLQSCSEEEKELLVYFKLIDIGKIDCLLDRIFERFVSMKADYNSIKNIGSSAKIRITCKSAIWFVHELSR
jgi:two-component system response regulator YesN